MENQLEKDIDTIARAEIVSHIEWGLQGGALSHEVCPDIGSHDWDAVAERIKAIIRELQPEGEVRISAYERLIERCDNEDS